jgi:hypothetical protein
MSIGRDDARCRGWAHIDGAAGILDPDFEEFPYYTGFVVVPGGTVVTRRYADTQADKRRREDEGWEDAW